MDISVVIPNYNGEKLLEKNLPKLLDILNNYKGGKVEIIIVDDGSTDESSRVISDMKLKNSNLRSLENGRNMGFSSTVNKGMKNASGEIVVLLNTDVDPEKDFLEPLLKHFEDDRVFAVGCMDKSMEGDKTILRGRGLGQWKRGFLIHRRGEVDKTSTLWVSAGSGAFRKSIWEKLGGLNELYNPFYYEDIDLSYRAVKSGYKILFERASVVTHEHEKGIIKNQYSQNQIKIIAYRNQFIFVWENADSSLIFPHVLWLPYHFIKALIAFDWPFLLGFLNAFLLTPKVLSSRHRAQRLFVKKDREVIGELA